MTARQFRELARRYSIDSAALLASRRWSGAYYLAGYAVECGLKASAANQLIRSERIPDRKWLDNFYTHQLVKLVNAAELSVSLQVRKAESDAFRRNWEEVVIKWTSEARYAGASRAMAEEMVRAVNDKTDGVLAWLRSLWQN
jgi:hypothetical protein